MSDSIHMLHLGFDACQRTKNRLREHGPDFRVIERRVNVVALKGVHGTLVESIADGWTGWLPTNEIMCGNPYSEVEK